MALSFYVLTGPTAAGKTAWLLDRARRRPLMVVSADSRQIYLYMNIGTGKPTLTDQKMLPHYVIDCINPSISYSVYQYLIDASKAFMEARKQAREVWVCGGTGLYIRALVERLTLGAGPLPKLRQALLAKFESTPPRQAAQVLKLDVVDPDNPVRVVRAAEQACAEGSRAGEIAGWAGLAEADLEQQQAQEREIADARAVLAEWECAGIAALDPGRQQLGKLIELRVRGMFSGGLLEEVAELREQGFGAAPVVRDGIGYREAGQTIDGQLSEDKAVERTIFRTRQYAKRQRTFIRGRGWPELCGSELDAWARRIGTDAAG